MDAPARRLGLGFVLVCLFSTLVVGFALKAPCASGSWQDGRQYRHFCYSDIVPLYGTEQLSGRRLPFLDDCRATDGECDEYPVLTMYAMRLAASTSSSFAGFFSANVALLTAAAFAIALGLYMAVGTRALYFALAPTLLLYGFMNWDLLAVAFATAATVAYLSRRDIAAGVLIGLGAATKVYPALLLVGFVLGRFREREPDRGIHLGWSAAGTWLAVNVPFALLATRSWWEFFRYNAARPADWDSLWFTACHRLITHEPYCRGTGLIDAASLALFVGCAFALWRMRRARDPDFPRWTFGFPLLVVFLLTNKVYSPQYGLWLLPWFALSLPDLKLFALFEATEVAVFVTRFSWFGRFAGFGGLPIGAFEVAVMLRAAILVWCLVAWVRGAASRERRNVRPELAGAEVPA